MYCTVWTANANFATPANVHFLSCDCQAVYSWTERNVACESFSVDNYSGNQPLCWYSSSTSILSLAVLLGAVLNAFLTLMSLPANHVLPCTVVSNWKGPNQCRGGHVASSWVTIQPTALRYLIQGPMNQSPGCVLIRADFHFKSAGHIFALSWAHVSCPGWSLDFASRQLAIGSSSPRTFSAGRAAQRIGYILYSDHIHIRRNSPSGVKLLNWTPGHFSLTDNENVTLT